MIVVVVAIVGLLLPTFEHSRPLRHRVDCAGNLKQIGLSLLMYSGDNKGYFPTSASNWSGDFGNVASEWYISSNSKVWACPSASTQRTSVDNSNQRTSVDNSNYIYIGSGLFDNNDRATGVTLGFDASGNHPDNDWMNAVFIDGHVEGARPNGSKKWNLN